MGEVVFGLIVTGCTLGSWGIIGGAIGTISGAGTGIGVGAGTGIAFATGRGGGGLSSGGFKSGVGTGTGTGTGEGTGSVISGTFSAGSTGLRRSVGFGPIFSSNSNFVTGRAFASGSFLRSKGGEFGKGATGSDVPSGKVTMSTLFKIGKGGGVGGIVKMVATKIRWNVPTHKSVQ